jgi:hypothetical protein
LLLGNANMARELAADLGKRVDVRVVGDEAAVTPETSEALGVLAVHALRNAIDHGIELPKARTDAGKNAAGSIRLSISRIGEMVSLVVTDDGAACGVEPSSAASCLRRWRGTLRSNRSTTASLRRVFRHSRRRPPRPAVASGSMLRTQR